MRPHSPAPSRARTATADWSQPALARTWRSFSVLCWSLAVLSAFLHMLPAALFSALGLWAQFKAAEDRL
jgi:hypothetical protein